MKKNSKLSKSESKVSVLAALAIVLLGLSKFISRIRIVVPNVLRMDRVMDLDLNSHLAMEIY